MRVDLLARVGVCVTAAALLAACGRTGELTTAGSESEGSSGLMTSTGEPGTSGAPTTGPSTTTGTPTTGMSATGTSDPTTGGSTTSGTTGAPDPVCGDGVVDPGEQCDDGPNNGPGQACNAMCQANACGDGDVGPGEECDDGADNGDMNSCKLDCTNNVCGDGKVGPGEGCDDGNQVDDDECNNMCVPSTCGDGVVAPTEQCDDGNADDTDACPSTCLNATCGDGYTEAGVEQCDVGNESPFCDGDCTLPECGDLHVNLAAGEECDDGSVTPDCDGDCTFPKCGDGFKNEAAGEECDDGNTAAGDGCSDTCAKEKRVVFVSSVLYTGNLGGLAGADAKCQQLANAAGLAGTFKAWLSDSQNSPSSRFLKSKVPYVLPGGAQIAKSWNDLTDGVIQHAIDQTEMKAVPPPAMQCNSKPTVWTNTREDGTSWNGNVCGNFTNTTADGRLGTSMAINYTWTRHCSGAAGTCAWKAPIYCFEQ